MEQTRIKKALDNLYYYGYLNGGNPKDRDLIDESYELLEQVIEDYFKYKKEK